MLEVHCAGDFQAAVPLFAREDQEQRMFPVTHAQAPLQVQVCAVLQCKVFYFFSVRSYFQRSIIRGSPMDFKRIIQLQKDSPLCMVFSPPLSSQWFCILQFSRGCGSVCVLLPALLLPASSLAFSAITDHSVGELRSERFCNSQAL